jgi:alpha-L-fucosidase
MTADIQWFKDARYGLFIHYGLYSMLGRGEWVLNREHIPMDEYRALADQFTSEFMDFDELIGRAKKDWGMRYAILTTKHHDGFCLYDSALTDFTSVKTNCRRDLVRDFVEACRKHDMRIGLYHSLNDWTNTPNAVDALERPIKCYQPFIDFVHGQIREIMTGYGKIDIMWYDGWWPFDGEGWQGEKLNAMVRELQPDILVNSRSAVPGDFDTPEGHISVSEAGRAWEACMTLNAHWGYHVGDHDWKSPKEVAGMLRQCAAGQGNLLLNVGPMGDGTVPDETVEILDKVGEWLQCNEEAIFKTERFVMDPHTRGEARSDWSPQGPFTAGADAFYWHITSWPGETLTLAGVECEVSDVVDLATGQEYPFSQHEGRVVVNGLPDVMDTHLPVVFRFGTKDEPCLYLCGGYTTPTVDHPRYDPVKPDIAY